MVRSPSKHFPAETASLSHFAVSRVVLRMMKLINSSRTACILAFTSGGEFGSLMS